MKKYLLICLLLVIMMIPSACRGQEEGGNSNAVSSLATEDAAGETTMIEQGLSPDENGPMPQEGEAPEKKLVLCVDGKALEVSWEENETVAELIAYLQQNETITVYTSLYGGFEQVGGLPQTFLRDDVQMTTIPGDIALYAGDQLVLFFGTNTWSYTMLGHIEGLSENELSKLLGERSAVVEIKGN